MAEHGSSGCELPGSDSEELRQVWDDALAELIRINVHLTGDVLENNLDSNEVHGAGSILRPGLWLCLPRNSPPLWKQKVRHNVRKATHPHAIFLRSILILVSNLCRGLTSGLFPWILCTFLICPVCATHHLTYTTALLEEYSLQITTSPIKPFLLDFREIIINYE
jgi:hypothetical protein